MGVLSTESGDSLERVGTERTDGCLETFKQSLLDFLRFFCVSPFQERREPPYFIDKKKKSIPQRPKCPGLVLHYFSMLLSSFKNDQS